MLPNSFNEATTCSTSNPVLCCYDFTAAKSMVTGSKNNGLPFQPFHRPRYNSGGSAWLLSGAILACGVAVPGLCFAWQLKQVTLAASVLITCWERCLWHCCTTLRATLCLTDAVKLQTKVAEPLHPVSNSISVNRWLAWETKIWAYHQSTQV